jgi:hypothetical protein
MFSHNLLFLFVGLGHFQLRRITLALLFLVLVFAVASCAQVPISDAGIVVPDRTRDAPPESRAGLSAKEEAPRENVVTKEMPDAEEENRRRQLAAISTATTKGDEAALREAVLSSDSTVATVALQNLTKLDPALAEDTLADAAKSDQPMTRLKALQLLDQACQADEDTVFSGLNEALRDPDPGVKVYAVQALAARGVPKAINYLRQAFRDFDLNLRMIAIEAVAQNEEGLPLLQDATTDADESVRTKASFLLAQATITGKLDSTNESNCR